MASRLRKMQNTGPAAKPKSTSVSAEAPVAAASAASTASTPERDLAALVGDKIRLTLKADGLSNSEESPVVEGVLFAYYHGLLVVQELEPVCVRVIRQTLLSGKPTVLKEKYIEDLNVLPNVDHDANARFYEEQVSKERKRREAIGKDVTPQAQKIYDILRQTFPMRWQEPHMIIMPGDGQTVLSPPYTVKELTGQDAQAIAALTRVLNGIRKKHKFDSA